MKKVGVKKIAFLDRDGIINVDSGYVYKPEMFEFVSGFPDLFIKLKSLGYIPVVVTNQSGVARGLFRIEDVKKFHDHINLELKKATGALIDYFYICPHHPDGIDPTYKRHCTCRKPNTGMIDKFEKDFPFAVDFTNSLMIGDKRSDIDLGLRKGIKTFQLNSRKYPLHDKAYFQSHKLEDIANRIASLG